MLVTVRVFPSAATTIFPSLTVLPYTVAVYRPAAGQRDALDKFLNEPPDRATDTSSGNVVLQHMEGAAWTFMAVALQLVAGMSKKDSGWFKLRNFISYHSDTLCDRLTP